MPVAPRIADLSMITANVRDKGHAWRQQAVAVAHHLRALAMAAVASGPTIYFEQADGAGGDGSYADPLHVNASDKAQAWADLRTHYASLAGTYPVFALQRKPGTALEMLRTANTTLTLTNPSRVHLRDEDDGSRGLVHAWQPLSAFTASDPTVQGNWTDNGDGSYSIATTTNIADLAVGAPQAAPSHSRYRADAFVHGADASIVTLAAGSGNSNACWWAAGTLRVQMRDATHPADADLYACQEITTEVVRREADGTHVVGAQIENGDYSSNEDYTDLNTTGLGVVEDSFYARAFKHIWGAATGTPNDLTNVSLNCHWHGGPADSSGFSHEVCNTNTLPTAGSEPDHISVGCRVWGGSYGRFSGTGNDYNTKSGAVFGHGSGTGVIGSVVVADLQVVSERFSAVNRPLGTSDNVAGSVVGWSGVTFTQEPYATVSTRLYPLELSDASDWSDFTHHITYHDYPPFGGTNAFSYLGSGQACRCKGTGFDIRIVLAETVPSSDRMYGGRIDSGVSSMDVDLVNGCWTVDTPASMAREYFPFALDGTNTAGQLFKLSEVVFAATGPNAAKVGVEQQGNKLNADADAADRGMRNCAFFQMTYQSHALTKNPVELTGYDPDASPRIGSELIVTGVGLPAARTPEADIDGRHRPDLHPTVGPKAAILSRGFGENDFRRRERSKRGS